MKLWNPFRRVDATSRDEAMPQETGTLSASDFVEWLISDMLQHSQLTQTIDTSRKLPTPGEQTIACETSAVINRLKFLSGVDPVAHSDPVHSQFVRDFPNYSAVVSTSFRDTGEKSVCSIKLALQVRKH